MKLIYELPAVFYTKMKIKRFLIIFSLFLLFLGCTEKTTSPQTQFVFGTVCTINLYKDGTNTLYNQIFSRLNEIEKTFSANLNDSVINQINMQAGIAPVQVTDEVLEVLAYAKEIAEKSNGAFDPTIGSLSSLWQIGFGASSLPAAEDIEKALSLVDYSKLHIDQTQKTVFLAEKGMRLDLGGIIKGYAADQITAILNLHRIEQAAIDLGGNIYVYGTKTDKSDWIVGIKSPEDKSNKILGSVSIKSGSVVTSGVYERFFITDSRRYHHILDSKTGYPVDNGLLSCTIISESSMRADALSTALFVLGKDNGLEFINNFPDTEALFVDETLNVYASENIDFKLRDSDYSFK